VIVIIHQANEVQQVSINMKKTAVVAVSSVALATATAVMAPALSAAPKTVSVSVGTGKPVQMKTGPLKIGVFMNAMSNTWQKNITQHEIARAKKYGYSVTVQDFNYDQQKMLNAMQTAVTNKTYDAWIVNPIDGVASCNMLTKTAPQNNIVVAVTGTPICGRDLNPADHLWSPGTYSQTSVAPSWDYYQRWFAATQKANPGAQKVALVLGPANNGADIAAVETAKRFMKAHPEFQVTDYLYGDFTAPTAFSQVQTYLQAHPDTTLLMSIYSPDLSQGTVKAVQSLGKTGKVKISDMGGSQYTVDQIKAGGIQLTLPYYPGLSGDLAVESIHDAQMGKTPPIRVYDEVPGGLAKAQVITSANVGSFKPQY